MDHHQHQQADHGTDIEPAEVARIERQARVAALIEAESERMVDVLLAGRRGREGGLMPGLALSWRGAGGQLGAGPTIPRAPLRGNFAIRWREGASGLCDPYVSAGGSRDSPC